MGKVVDMGGSRLRNFFWFQRDPLGFLERVREVGDVVMLHSGRHFHSGFHSSYVIHDPEVVRQILVTKEHSFRKGRSSSILGRTLGEGLLTSEGETHDQQKRMMQPAFYKLQLPSYADAVKRQVQHTLHQWDDGAQCRVEEEMMALTLRIICETMFGTLPDRATLSEMGQAVDLIIERTARCLYSPISIPFSVPTWGNLRHKRAIQTVEGIIYPLIQSSRNEKGSDRPGMLSLLCGAVLEDGSLLSDKEIRDQMFTLLIAGHETTANALTWTWLLLSQHPEVEKKFHAEVDTVLKDGALSFDDISRLPYTYQIIQEALRLYPPAWLILRESKEEVELSGCHFGVNSVFLISPFTIHRHPAFYDEPLRFCPERFAKNSDQPIPTFAYFPFGGGSRSCIGSHFAMMEAVLILAAIGRQYRLHWAPDQEIAQPEPLVSLRVKDGLRMKLQRR